MTLQEKELLTRFLQQLATAQAAQKDTEAAALIKEAVSQQPDASYLLVQRAIQLEHLLQASQEEVQKLQTELGNARTGSPRGGFLNDNAWGSRAATVNREGHRPGTAAAAVRGGSWGSGLFGNIAATAAGVVAGSFLFQGIQGLMNRGETPDRDLFAQDPVKEAQVEEPELLNSFDTTGGDGGDSFVADADGGGDFA